LNTIELLKIYQVWQWSKSNMVIPQRAESFCIACLNVGQNSI
jgi:hypothetical protein